MSYNKLSESEVLESLHSHIFQIEETKLENSDDYKTFLSKLPVGVQINTYEGECRFMSGYTQDFLRISPEELNMIGKRYMTMDIFHQDEVSTLLPKVKRFHEHNLLDEKLSFYQRVKPRGKKHFEWVYICSRLIRTSGNVYNDRLLITCPVNEMGEQARQLSKLLDENLYFKAYIKKYDLLTRREKEIIPLVATGYTNNDISEMLFISKETVGQHRKNINSKLEFKTYYELIKFSETFELL